MKSPEVSRYNIPTYTYENNKRDGNVKVKKIDTIERARSARSNSRFSIEVDSSSLSDEDACSPTMVFEWNFVKNGNSIYIG